MLGPSSSAPFASAPTRVSFWEASDQSQCAGSAGGALRERVKFFFRALGQPKLTRAWLARLVQPDLAPLWALRPRLATKLQRPYVSCAWDPPVRLAALIGHYDILPRLLGPEPRRKLFQEGLDVLQLVNSGSGQRCELQLFYHDQFEKEGELTLALRNVETGLVLAGLTFCLAHHGDQRLVIIGGLQASNDPRIRGLIHDFAKGLHGLRPKALVLWCLQQLTVPWEIGQIQAVGDGQHIYRHRHKRREVAASYDEFWRESDGEELPGGGSWQLPLQPRQRRREELKPNRRKAHELRYAVLTALRPELLAAFAVLAPDATAEAGPREFLYAGTETGQNFPAAEVKAKAGHSF